MLEPSKDILSECCAKTDINIPTNNSGSNDFKNRNKSIWTFYSILSSNLTHSNRLRDSFVIHESFLSHFSNSLLFIYSRSTPANQS